MALALGGIAAGIAAPRRACAALPGKPLIMLDPGHGGHDPGAIAPDGEFEKHITLATGLDLRRALLRTGRYRVAMTRSKDVFVTLEGRVAAAVKANASLFLALHCDHLPDPDMRGASVFTLSDNASDTLAASIANDENNSDSAPGQITGVSPQVANILASLETRATKIGSQSLAQDIQDSFQGIVPLLPDPHRSANFAVLRDPSTPATLLEMGCLTNKLDEQRLRDPKQRKLLTEHLTLAIDQYFADYAGRRLAG
ncbi:MAG: N-acetylmuramoyl-L-alanine amidase family protein [Acidocella sp.]|uniref:N-acetylmuramoyl-L-alanine amidase family protein n=1 Tax=Acidocella sp. TaxID=50710 RepID=UPI003FBDD1F3